MTAIERLVVRLVADASEYHRIFNTAETRLLTFAGVASAVTLEAGKAAVKLAADYEDAAVAFKVLTGSAETSVKMLADIDRLAIATPFTSDQLREQAKTMAGFGISVENILPSLKALGDVVAGVGGGAERLHRIMYNFSQVVAQGRPYWIDIKQFAMAGINIEEFARTAGVGVSEFRSMVEAGQIGSDVIVNTFNRMTQAGGKFHGMMDELSQTSRGQWNSLKEQGQLVLRNVGLQLLQGLKESGAFDYLTELLNNIKNNMPAIKETFREAFSSVKEIVAMLEEAYQQWRAFFKEVGEFFKEHNDTLKGAAAGIGSVFGASKEDVESWKVTFEGFMAIFVVIPAAIKDSMNFLRLGMFTILAGMARILDEIFTRAAEFWNRISRNAKSIGLGDWGTLDAGPGFLKIAESEFAAGAKESWDKLGATKAAMDAFVDRLIAAKKAGADVRDILKEIGAIKTPPNILPPDLVSFLEKLKKDFTSHGSPIDKFQKEFEALKLSNALFWANPGGATIPVLDNAAFNFGVLKIFKDLEHGLGKILEPKLPDTLYRGTKEAQDVINKANIKQQSTAERVLQVLELSKVLQEDLKKEAEDIRKAIEGLQDKGLLKKGF